MRPTRDEIYLNFAYLLAARSTCLRARVGAVVTDVDGLQVLGVGYNGNARGLPNECDRLTVPGDCGCVHAELNALLKAPGTLPGKALYATTAPCERCAKAILNAGVARVVYHLTYRQDAGLRLLHEGGVTLVQHSLLLGVSRPAPGG